MPHRRKDRWSLLDAVAAERYLQGGAGVTISDSGACSIVWSAEVLTDEETTRVLACPGGAWLILAAARWEALVQGASATSSVAGPAGFVRLALPASTRPWVVRVLIDPTTPADATEVDIDFSSFEVQPVVDATQRAAVLLAKHAGLLPAVLSTPEPVPGLRIMASLEASAVFEQRRAAARSLEPVGEAVVPTRVANNARLITFRSRLGGPQHQAVLVGDPRSVPEPLCRLHSECLTGDVFGSLRCDCGDQLRGALAAMEREGAGVLVYLAQEGRGIGLTNKLRAYRLQDAGADTVDANIRLGFEPDERDFLAAATVLRCLEIERVRLLTNNPDKVEALSVHGIEVAERVPHAFAPNDHNVFYLQTKARRAGHLLGTAETNPSACTHRPTN